jgi:hypothetical protein
MLCGVNLVSQFTLDVCACVGCWLYSIINYGNGILGLFIYIKNSGIYQADTTRGTMYV